MFSAHISTCRHPPRMITICVPWPDNSGTDRCRRADPRERHADDRGPDTPAAGRQPAANPPFGSGGRDHLFRAPDRDAGAAQGVRPGASGRPGLMADRFAEQNSGGDKSGPRAVRRDRVPVVRRGAQGPDRRARGPLFRDRVPGQRPAVRRPDSRSRTAVAIALNLVPFAGIAFLWFVGVLRDRIGEREDRFFATVFLGSGLLFVALLFAAAAIGGGLIADMSSSPPGAGTLALGRDVTSILLNVYAMRMAAVFTLATVTIARRTEIVSRWLTVAGLVTALVLLVGVGISPWFELLFPAWILALSMDILAAGLRKSPGSTKTARP